MVRKKGKQRIILSWMFLAFFAAGQTVVYSHQHQTIVTLLGKATHQSSKQSISDKCQLCDAMHANHMVVGSHVYAHATPVSFHLFGADCYDFVSLSLILSPGRAPPVS